MSLEPSQPTETSVLETNTKIAWGYTSTVYRISDELRVLKVIDKGQTQRTFDREVAAYRRMSERNRAGARKPSSILEFFGTSETIGLGIILEYASNGSLHGYLWDCLQGFNTSPTSIELNRWAIQTTEALAFVHECGILHCDVHAANCFLNDHLNIKLGDFGGCAIDDGQPLMLYRRTHQLWKFDDKPNQWRKEISVRGEIFALGCTMFSMETSRDPFDEMDYEKDKEAIARRIQTRAMPSLAGCPVLRGFIQRCWSLEYQDMKQVIEHMKAAFEVDQHVRVET